MRLQRLKDRLCFPLLVFLSSEAAESLGLTPIDDERRAAVLDRCRGLALDIGCGMNEMLQRYRSRQGFGVGVDIYSWPGCDVVCDTIRLPFPASVFDTVTMLACLNHVSSVKRDAVLQEAKRVLKDDGQLLITMINPFVGFVVHKVRHRHDPDQLERGMSADEAYGLSPGAVRELLTRNGFHVAEMVPFVFGLNRLYIARKSIYDRALFRVAQ